jgi:hypothetical protein
MPAFLIGEQRQLSTSFAGKSQTEEMEFSVEEGCPENNEEEEVSPEYMEFVRQTEEHRKQRTSSILLNIKFDAQIKF